MIRIIWLFTKFMGFLLVALAWMIIRTIRRLFEWAEFKLSLILENFIPPQVNLDD